MKLGEILIYIGKSNRFNKKYSKYSLICIYDDNRLIGVQLYGSDDENDFFIRDKSLFINLKEFRKQKLNKLKYCI